MKPIRSKVMPDLSMKSSEFDKIMRHAFQTTPVESSKSKGSVKGKGVRKKK